MKNRSAGRRGQALLLVTFALFAMCGLLGLAVDLGWGYFVKKSAQASADAGALAGANAALALVQQNGTLLSKWATQGVPCPYSGVSTDPVSTGCQYAQQVGLQPPGFGGTITMAAGVPSVLTGTCPSSSAPPTVPNLTNWCYWVTARAVQVIPQLFSAVLGNPTGISSARATAAVVDVIVNGSLITLGRSGDPVPMNTDVSLGGSAGLTLVDGLWAAATSNNAPQGVQASGGQINGAILEISPATNPNAGGTNVFAALPDGAQFGDPTAFKGVIQPPLPTTALNTYAVLSSGSLNGAIYQVDANDAIISQLSVAAASVTLPPGNYFPANDPSANPAPGDVVTINKSAALSTSGTVTFSNSGNFGSYFFYGGLTVTGTVNMGAGEYVVVGGGPNGGLTVNGVLQDPNSALDGGQMIIVTGTTGQLLGSYPTISNNQNSDLYPGLTTQLNSNTGLAQMLNSSSGAFGQTTFNTAAGGANDPTGLNAANIIGTVSSYLSAFNGVVFWQDQANSMILYNPTPQNSPIQTSASCNGGNTINIPCPTPSSYTISPNINFNANGDVGLRGVFYQPRGASLTANGNVTGNLQVVTGSFISSGGSLNLQDPPQRLKRRIVALIE